MFGLAWPPREKRGSTGRVQDSDVWRKGHGGPASKSVVFALMLGASIRSLDLHSDRKTHSFSTLQLSLISPKSTPRPGLSSAFCAKEKTTASSMSDLLEEGGKFWFLWAKL